MDFWRYTPEAMKQLFPDLECLHASFYSANRRRNNLGSAVNPVDGDGGAQFSEDAFGGWRENWFTLYAGRKTDEAARNLNRRRMQQLAIDAVAMLQEGGTPEPDIYERASEIVAAVRFDAEGDIHARSAPSDNRMSPARVRSLWRRKRQLGMPASPNQAAALRALLSERPTAQAQVRRLRP